MRFAIFGFDTPNLGDDVQALAAAALLPRIDAYVNRDRLDKVRLPQTCKLIMNSWFAIKRYHATPSQSIEPIYFGQCIGRPELLNDAWLAEWRKHQPIGLRDRHSVDLLRRYGVEAHFTGCLTTWMGRFFAVPERREGIVFLDVPEEMESFIPADIRGRAERITNATAKGNDDQPSRFRACAKILDRLRTAEMVVTRRLHASLPCVGFGTPVTVYLEGGTKNRRRFSGSDEIMPVIYHDGKRPEGEVWVAPRACSPTAEMEAHFKALCERLGVTVSPRWTSVSQMVEQHLPEIAREPRSLWQRLRAA